MGSPFAGVTPHPEDTALWPAFHHELVACLYRTLLPLLSDRYHARIAQRCYRAEETLGPSQTFHEETIEICERRDGRLVTLIDVVSPANRKIESGRRALLATRDQARGLGASIVEIDLIGQGGPWRDDAGEGLPNWDYVITVTRSTRPESLEVYAAALPLPRIGIPLASDDADTLLDVSNAVAHAFDRDRFASRSLSTEEAWLSSLLGPRRSTREESSSEQQRPLAEPVVLAHEAIAIAAYFLWEHERYPHGRDKEHWYRAIDQLQRAARELPG